jgi:starch-binding outer membrane protein, SusD/RagB family
MKKTIKIAPFFYTIFLAVSLISCDNYLDEIPDNRVELDNLDKAAQLLTNGYSTASPAFTDWMTDDVQFTIGTTILNFQQQLYDWEDVTNIAPEDDWDNPDHFWYETYQSIAHANEVLAVLDKLPVNSIEDKAKRDAVEAEAKLIRAYGHFMLVNMFGQHYNSSTASKDLGVPYVKDPETVFIQQYTRQSVKKVYGEIEDDLLDGLKLVNDNFYSNSGKYHFTKNAALAFASRFYLYKGDFIRCLQYSDELLGAEPQTYVRDMTSLEFQQAKSSITGYPQLYSSTKLAANLLLVRKLSLIQRTDYAFAASNDFYNGLFGENPFPGTTDERENPAFVKGLSTDGNQGLFPVRYENLFQRSSINSNVGIPYHIGIMFRGEEVLFNRIECNIFLNNLDKAMSDFNVLFARRYSGANNQATLASIRKFIGAENVPSFGDQDVLLNFLFLEKRKEFITQGLRWFDAKRFGITMAHDYENGSTRELKDQDPRWVMQIPLSAQQVAGLEPNPR